ncbi:MAG: hypothetical protein CL678_16945 [Bdellovibrionaceae bacterium]|nr:hypothetical protein [Pseudobdellovibrionaceae bacterium]|tara:strand:- start:1820 stop:2152 length:333 start_codon:yes stop_codon:yes gene_type:complete
MWFSVIKVIASALLIALVSHLSHKKTALAGFLTALPITSLLALGFSQIQWSDSQQSVEYAKSIFAAIPLSLLFFLPFLLAQKLNLSFWTCYGLGIGALGVGYWIHQIVLK